MSEQTRFDFLISRDGIEKAVLFTQDLIRTYRKIVIQKKILTLKRKELIKSYVEAKQILRKLKCQE